MDPEKISLISEQLCIGCGVCVKVCPFDAIDILNLSEELKKDKIHQYGVNSFRLFKIPTVRKGQVVGLVGRNGIGKSTALKVLAGSLVPNLGDYEHEPTWDKFLSYLSGREMKEHFERVAEGEIEVALKPQAVYKIPEAWSGDVRGLLGEMDERKKLDEVVEALSLGEALAKSVRDLSGGELQRLAVAAAALKDADLYLFDEPSSYNDVYQRLAVSKLIRGLAESGRAVLVVEHDMAFLDYVADYVQIIYGSLAPTAWSRASTQRGRGSILSSTGTSPGEHPLQGQARLFRAEDRCRGGGKRDARRQLQRTDEVVMTRSASP